MKSFCKLVITLLITVPVFAQKGANVVAGNRQTLRSQTLGETRDILISAPDRISRKVPLILVFDAENLFLPVVSAVKFMHGGSEMPQIPEAVVVGIINTDRNRDMPPPQQYAGKGEVSFMKFITTELIPSIRKLYPLNDHVITIGHSQGAQFVIWLQTQAPETFCWTIALDAPVNVDNSTKALKTALSKTLNAFPRLKYVSAEAMYGWKDEWSAYMPVKGNAMKINFSQETHESMPFKGIYDALKFLYRDFSPLTKDLTLAELQLHYRTLSVSYGFEYDIPLKTLLNSASRKMVESRKAEILTLLDFAEAQYGTTERIDRLRATASGLKQADPVVDTWLTLASPTPEQIKPYLGRWTGFIIVPRGTNMPVDTEILIENGVAKMQTVVPWAPGTKEAELILHVNAAGELIFGRKNGGGGLFISTASINQSGELVGKQQLTGYTIPDDMPEDAKKHMRFVMENPNTFTLTKK